MRRILLLCALLSSAAFAQSPTRATADCAALNCEFRLAVDGGKFSHAYVTITNSGTSTVAWEQSSDYGYNFVAAPYSKRIDVASSNPAVASSSTTSGVYEIPLSSSVTSLRGRVATYSPLTTITFKAAPLARPYSPGGRVRATLYDATNATTVTPTTGVLDASGWSNVLVWTQGGTSSTPSAYAVDDAGVSSTLALWTSVAGVTRSWVTFGDGGALVSTSSTSFGGASAAVPVVPRRMNVTGTGGTTTRIVVEAGR